MSKKLVGILLVLCLVLSSVAVLAEETITMRWFITLADDHPVSVATKKMAESIATETNGRIKLEVFTNSVLGSESEGFDMIRSGTIEAGVIGQALFPDYSDAASTVMLPYAFTSVDAFMAWMRQDALLADGEFGEKFTEATGTVAIDAHTSGFRHLTTNKPVKTPADLKGMNIRSLTTELGEATVNGLGGNAVAVAFSELYTALQTNVVDGQENPLSTIYANAFYEVQDNLVMTSHMLASSLFIVNEKFWGGLSAEDQALITKYVAIAADEINDDAVNGDADYIAKLTENGMTILAPEEFDFEGFKTNCVDYVKKTLSGKAYDAIWALQEEIVAWQTANGY